MTKNERIESIRTQLKESAGNPAIYKCYPIIQISRSFKSKGKGFAFAALLYEKRERKNVFNN